MRCEVCGRKIHGKPVKALIEGARLTVCDKCAEHGAIIWEESRALPQPQLGQKIKPATLSKYVPMTSAKQRAGEVSLELVDDYDVRVKQAREKMGLTHEELGKKINEKVSVLKKIETKKIKPDDKLAAKLEHALKIKLLVPASEDKGPILVPKQSSRPLTIGDLICLEKKEMEEEV